MIIFICCVALNILVEPHSIAMACKTVLKSFKLKMILELKNVKVIV